MAIKNMQSDSTSPTESDSIGSSLEVPWQIWVTVVLLGLEGVGNLIAIPQAPVAATWLAAKCLFIVGLIRGWRWVFVLFLVVGCLHVLAFSSQAPFVAFLNLAVVVLVGSTLGRFFPGGPGDAKEAGQEFHPRDIAEVPPGERAEIVFEWATGDHLGSSRK